MTRLKTLSALAATAVLVPAIAFADITVGGMIGKTEADIRAMLEKEGYTVDEIEIEKDEIEVEVTRNGQKFEIEISPDTGKIMSIELEDDEDDDKDD